MIVVPPTTIAQVQVIPTPSPAPSSTPVSERSALNDRLDAIVASTRAKTGGTLGVVIWDLGTGVSVQDNAQASFSMAGVQRLVLAIVGYIAIDSGKFPNDRVAALPSLIARALAQTDETSVDALLRALGGASAVNDSMRALGFDDIVFHADESSPSVATPASIALLLNGVETGNVLSPHSRTELLANLALPQSPARGVRAGFPAGTFVANQFGTSPESGGAVDATNDAAIVRANRRSIIVVAMLRGASGKVAERDAVLASVARLAYDATRLFPMP